MGKLSTSLPPFTVEQSLQTFSEVYDWGLRDLNVPEIHKKSLGEGIKIAVIDSGKSEHFETINNTVGAKNFSKSPHLTDKNGHSTMCAGIVAAEKNNEGVIGVAPKAKLYFAKAMDDAGRGDPSALVRAINWAANRKVDIMSISAGMFFDFKPLQRAVKRAHRKNIIICAAVGNCLAKETRIKTKFGWKYIEKIKIGDEVYSWNPKENNTELCKVKKVFIKRKDKVFRISTFTRSIEATSSHRFLCATSLKASCKTSFHNPDNDHYLGVQTFWKSRKVRNEYFYEWKKLSDIRVGDYILIDKCVPFNRIGKIPKNVSENLLYFYGILLGDGWITVKKQKDGSIRTRFGIASPENSPHTKCLISAGEQVFNKKFAQNNNELSLHSSEETKKMALMFPLLANKKCLEKRMEPWVFSLPIEQKIAIIRGFLDSDGTTTKSGCFTFYGSNKNLIQDLYELCISSNLKVTNIYSRNRTTNFGKCRENSFSITNFDSIHRVSSGHPIKFSRIKKRKCPEGERNYKYHINEIYNLLNKNTVFDRVQSIKDIGSKDVYDIEVPKYNNFIANNIIVHNSGTRNYDVAFPARYPEVIGVAAYNQKHHVAKFSSRGANVSFALPGVDIYSTYLNNQFAKLSGTSFSCPLMAGVCALILSKHRSGPSNTPCETPQQMLEHLQKYSKKLDSKKETGFGTIDLDNLFSKD